MNKKLSKVLSLMVALVLVVGVFAGCSKPAEKGPTKLTIWHGWSGAEEQTLKDLVAKYQEANKNVTIELLPSPFDKLQDKLKASIPAGEGPDLFVGPHDWAGTLAALNLLAPVDEYIKDVKGDYLESALNASKYNGKFYGIPESVKTTVLFYNKDLVPTAPKTLDEAREIAKKNTNVADKKYGLIFKMEDLFFGHAYYSALGGKIFSDEKGTPAFNTDAAVKTFTLYNEIKNKDKVTLENFDYNVMMDLFNTGKAAMMVNGAWAFGDVEKAVTENKGLKNWGAVVLPELNGKPANPFMNVETLYVSAQSKNKEAAAKFATFMTNAENGKYLNEKAGHVPANGKVQLADWKAKLILDAAKNGVAMPNIPEMGKIWTPYETAVKKVFAGELAPDAAAKEAQATMEKDIKEMQGK